MKKKYIRKRKYNNYIKIIDKKRHSFKKQSFCQKNILKLLIYLIILLIFITLSSQKIFFAHRKKIPNSSSIKSSQNDLINKEADIRLKIEQLRALTNNITTLYEGAENCLTKNPDEELCIYQFLCPKEVVNKTRVLFGPRNDGSYVLHDNLENIKITYSIGIDHKIEFDKAIANRGIDVYMYDHTIDKLPFDNEKFHWKKIGIGGNKNRTYNIQTLQEMIKENGHLNEKNMILKMDVEGAEWETLKDTPENVLLQFKYLVFELHFRDIYNPLIHFYNVLKKLHKSRQVFYIHCNPYSPISTFGNNRICSWIEVSYIIREGTIFTKDKSIYPIGELIHGYYHLFNVNIFKLFDNYVQS